MITLGIDAASSSGWAIVGLSVGRLRLYDFGKVHVTNFRSLARVVTTAVEAHVDLAGLEVPYVDKNPDTAIKLGMVVGRWQQELERAGLPYVQHKAAEWQYKLLRGLIVQRSPREERKKAAALWVKSQFQLTVGEDEADGICFATWLAKTKNVEQLGLRPL